MKFVFCWTNATGYTNACWRALAEREGVDVHVFAFKTNQSKHQTAFDASLFDGINHTLFDPSNPEEVAGIPGQVAEQSPDALAIAGWAYKPYMKLASDSRFQRTRKIMGIDHGWFATGKQRLNCLLRRSYMRRFDALMTPGERGYQYGIRLGMEPKKIHPLMYGYDDSTFDPIGNTRSTLPEDWPRRFLFAGRYVAVKGLPEMLAAYDQYRNQVNDPWELACCGRGPEVERITQHAHAIDLGFQQPPDLAQRLSESGAFILPSNHEPWGVVVSEAMAAGLPVICTRTCGAGVELVRQRFTGMVYESGDVSGLTKAMRWIHDNVKDCPAWQQRCTTAAGAYAASKWAEQWHAVAMSVSNKG